MLSVIVMLLSRHCACFFFHAEAGIRVLVVTGVQPCALPTSELKLGKNNKVELISPSGERVKVKFKKIDQYLMKGYTRG